MMSMPAVPPSRPTLHRFGKSVYVRPVTLSDCTQRYEAWLADPRVNRFLETRWQPQTGQTILEYVRDAITCDNTHLMAIVETSSGRHVGNVKIGPMNPRH